MRPARTAALGLVVVGLLTAAGPARGQAGPHAGERTTVRIPGTEIAFELAYVPAGSFRLGSPASETGRDPDEGPERRVELAPFWIGVHEVTDEEFGIFRHPERDSGATAIPGILMDVDAISRPSPPYEDPAHGLGKGRHPATGMTRWAALQYARWLSEKTGRLFRLPTEAEWEYACEAGSDGPFGAGIAPDGLERAAWYEANSGETHHPVGGKAPNAWGIHDMHGNVAEWTLDAYRPDAYAALEEPARAPGVEGGGTGPHAVRGGAFDDPPDALRCAERLASTPRWQRRDPQIPKSRWWNTDAPHVGFRLVSPAVEMSLEEIRAYWARLLPDP